MNTIMIKPKDVKIEYKNTLQFSFLHGENIHLARTTIQGIKCFVCSNLNFNIPTMYIFEGTNEYAGLNDILSTNNFEYDNFDLHLDTGIVEDYCNKIALDYLIQNENYYEYLKECFEKNYCHGLKYGKQEIQKGLKSLLGL